MREEVKAELVGNFIQNSAPVLNTCSVLTFTASGSYIPGNVEGQADLVNGKLLAQEAGCSRGQG